MVKQKFKGKDLTARKVINNILKVHNNTEFSADKNWYVEANQLAQNLARKYNVDVLQASGVIASLSPLKSWDENKKIAEAFLRTGRAKHTAAMTNKAKDILTYKGTAQREYILNTLNGNKIQSFFLNIAFPTVSDKVTIDRHAVAIALGRNAKDNELKDITDNQYLFFEDCYKAAAAKAGLLPHELQAVTWVKWRLLKTKEKFADVPF